MPWNREPGSPALYQFSEDLTRISSRKQKILGWGDLKRIPSLWALGWANRKQVLVLQETVAKRQLPWCWALLTPLGLGCLAITINKGNLHKQNTEFAIKELKFKQNGKCSFPSQEHVARGKVTYFANWITSLIRDFGSGGGKKCTGKWWEKCGTRA